VSGRDAINDTPEIGKPILNRRTSQRDTEIGIHRFGGVRQTNPWGLHLLSLVQQHCREAYGPEIAIIVAQRLIRG
jgi:hypothetical protein